MERVGNRAGAPEDVEFKNLEDFARLADSPLRSRISVRVPPSKERLNLKPTEYKLGRHDELNIFVMDHPEMSSQRVDLGQISGTTIKEDGNVHLPVLGNIPAAGKTLIEFETLLKERVANFVGRPEVSVEILKYRSKQFYVLGQVTAPGVFAVDGRTSLLQGLSNAGGLLPNANLSRSFLVRNGKLMPVDLMGLVEGGDIRQNVYMRDGDLVFVASSQDEKVIVVGEVRQPGVVPIVSGRLTLGQALAQAGGPTMARARRELAVVRGGYARPTVYTMDLESALLVDERLLLQPGDRVIVAPTGLSQASRYMEQVLPFLNGVWAIGFAANSGVDIARRAKEWAGNPDPKKMGMEGKMMGGDTMNNNMMNNAASTRRISPRRIQAAPRN